MSNDRVMAISGILFAAAVFSGLLLLIDGVAAGDTTNHEAATWLSEGGHRTQMMFGMYMMSAGAMAFAVFAAGLFRRLRDAGAPQLAVSVGQLAAIAFTVLSVAAAIGMASGAYAVVSNVEPQPIDPAAVRLSTFGFALWTIGAALAASVFVAATSLAAIVSGALPRWLALIGFLFSALLPFGIAFLPTLSVLVWAMLVSVVTLVRPSTIVELRTGAPA